MGVERFGFQVARMNSKADCTQKPILCSTFGCILSLAEGLDVHPIQALDWASKRVALALRNSLRSGPSAGWILVIVRPLGSKLWFRVGLSQSPGHLRTPGHSKFRHSSNPVDCDFPSLYGYQGKTATTEMLLTGISYAVYTFQQSTESGETKLQPRRLSASRWDSAARSLGLEPRTSGLGVKGQANSCLEPLNPPTRSSTSNFIPDLPARETIARFLD